MTHSLVLEIPESIYQPLAKEAKARGLNIEEIAIKILSEDSLKSSDDSLDQFIGAFETDISDFADRHDYYIGENLANDLKLSK